MSDNYEKPRTEEYGDALGNLTLTSGATLNVIGPKGKVGLVRDIVADVQTSINATTVPEVAVGISSADASYGRFRLGTSASAGYGTGAHRASQKLTGPNNGLNPQTLSDFAGHVSLATAKIPADTAFTIATTAASSAGAARIKVIIDWF